MKKWRSMDLFGSVENLFHHGPSSPSDRPKGFRHRLSSLSAKDDSTLNKGRDSGDGGTPTDHTVENQMIKRCVIVQRDDKGYGLTVSGDNPVYVQSVKAEGAAARCGVQEGDKILKVNGTLVTNKNHIDVVKLIKSGPLVALILMGKPPPNSLDKSATIITPQNLSSSSNRVTAPQPVDPEKDKELWQQKVHTTRAMFEQAKEDHEKLKRNYVKNPSEKLNAQLLEKERTVKRLEEQLKNITGSGDISPSTPLSSMSDTEKSPMDQNSNTSWTSSLPSSVPTISDAGSLSDSPPTSPSISPTPSHPFNRQDVDNCSTSSRVDSGIEDGSGLPNQSNIITIDDEDINSEEEITGDAGPFSDITALEKKPAHLGIFLHYLISNSDPSPVFFYIISDQYSHAQGSSKDMKKWAYEIYSTFLAPNAPLSAGLGDNVITTIDSALTTNSGKITNDNALRTVFEPARNAVKGIIQDLLADFRQKKDLGLGSIYGTHELRDDMDKQSESKMIEKYLMNHLTNLVGEDKSDREQAMGYALATFLRQTVSSKASNTGMMERVQSFVMKDKRKLNFPITKSKTKTVKGHQFSLQHYYMVTFCAHCNSLIWGVGYQGYQCNSCEINVHRQCVDDLQETCTGKQKKRDKRASGMIPVIPSIRKFSNPNPSAGSSFTVVNEALQAAKSSEDGGKEIVTTPVKRDEEADFAGLPVGHSVKSIVNRYERPSPEQPSVGSEDDDLDDQKEKNKKKKEVGRSESMKGRTDKKDRDSKKRSKSDVDVDDSTIKALNQSGSSSTSSLGADNMECSEDLPTNIHPDEQTDSDLDVENDLPPLKSIIGEEALRKLKPKEKKRQEVLNELVHTERAHVRNLKILDKLFFRPMAAETATSDLAKQLLPNIHQMIRLHSAFNNNLKALRKENPVIGEVGDLFLKRFDGEEGDVFKNNCAQFCRGQSFALDALKKQQRKEQRLSQFLNDAESNPLCRRLQLKDLVPTQFQRLTKYPLLIENLLKYTQTNTEEYRKLTLAHQKTKEILAEVNQSVKEYENHQRLKILQKKMKYSSPDSQEGKHKQVHEDMKHLDLTQHKLVYEGELTWRLRPNRLIDMHVILLEDILVLLQKQDEKLVLKCQSLNVHNQSDPLQSGRADAGKGYTHSPILKLQNLLSRNVATDKKAFFVINTSEAGPQIYELIASNQTSRKTWHNHINTWAEICKSKKSQKPTTTPAKAQPSSEITTPQPEEITEIRDRIKVRQPDHLSRAETNTQDSVPSRQDSEILETAEVKTEPELARPSDVKVSNLVVAQSKPVLTPLEQLKKTDDQMIEILNEKEKLVASLTNLPLEEYRLLTEQSDYEDQDSRALLAAGFRHMDDLTHLISTGCDLLVNQPQDSIHSKKGPGVNVPIPMSQLKEMAAKMNSILTNLLSAVGNSEEERDRLRIELKAAQDQLNVLREIQRSAIAGEPSSQSRPASMVSVASSVSEHGETTETDDDTAQESDQEMVEHQTELMDSEHQDSDHEPDPDPDPDNQDTDKEGESSAVDPVGEGVIDKIESETVQTVNSAPSECKDKSESDLDDTLEEKPSNHVAGDGQVINHVKESDNDIVLEQVTVNESSDYDTNIIPLNQSENCNENCQSNEDTAVKDTDDSDHHQDIVSTTTNSDTPMNSNFDSNEGANFSDSDSTVTPGPFFSEMGDSEIDNMAKSDATLVGSINSILSDSDSVQDPPNKCDVSCDSQRTNENELESVQSEQSNKPGGIEL